jgi:hypothetical protein
VAPKASTGFLAPHETISLVIKDMVRRSRLNCCRPTPRLWGYKPRRRSFAASALSDYATWYAQTAASQTHRATIDAAAAAPTPGADIARARSRWRWLQTVQRRTSATGADAAYTGPGTAGPLSRMN